MSYEPQQAVVDDEDSQATYGRQDLAVTLPLPVSNAQIFAASLANYLLDRHSQPVQRFDTLTFNDSEVGSVDLLTLDIGQVAQVSDYQTGITNARGIILGLEGAYDGQRVFQMALFVQRLDDVTYGILDNATYGVLDSTARLFI